MVLPTTDEEWQRLYELEYQIESAPDRTENITTIDLSPFYEEPMTHTRTISSEEVGYKIVETYIWQEVYNSQGQLGGYALQDVKKEYFPL